MRRVRRACVRVVARRADLRVRVVRVREVRVAVRRADLRDVRLAECVALRLLFRWVLRAEWRRVLRAGRLGAPLFQPASQFHRFEL